MAGILIKTQPAYEQTGLAIKGYLRSKGTDCDIIKSNEEFLSKKHLYEKIIEPNVHCVNTVIFKQKGNRVLDSFYWGDFSVDRLLNLKDYPKLHVYGTQNWPTHQFITKCDYADIPFLCEKYKRFIVFDNDQDWLYMSLIYSGCEPIIEKNVTVLTVDNLVKELGLE